jgi:hypothetical protein
MTLVLVATFLYVVLSGPAFDDLRAADVVALDAPAARVVYLPSSRCRPREFDAE